MGAQQLCRGHAALPMESLSMNPIAELTPLQQQNYALMSTSGVDDADEDFDDEDFYEPDDLLAVPVASNKRSRNS